jgi:hypothetical protein
VNSCKSCWRETDEGIAGGDLSLFGAAFESAECGEVSEKFVYETTARFNQTQSE